MGFNSIHMGGEIVFYSIVALFILAIASVWLFPNKKVSDNEHDIKH